jgi:hypothetical protein
MSAPPASSAERAATGAERSANAVRTLAREPRPAGSDAEARARDYCVARLRAAGFDVHEEPFEYSAFVGRWGTPIGGVVATAMLLGASVAGRGRAAGVALALLTLGGTVLALGARALARDGVLTFPAQRRRGVNVVAVRRGITGSHVATGGDERAIWLMAHLDSKSQPVPILARAAGITVLGLTWIAGVVVSVTQLAGPSGGYGTAWGVLAAGAVLGAIPVIATTVGAHSPGALDNASGVATVLAAAEDAQGTDFGVCLTSAEELGLAGARAWVRNAARGEPGIAINCDGVDDGGATTCMYSGRRPDSLVSAVLQAGARTDATIRAHRLLPGVLTDGVALADAGWRAVTLSRGGIRTLARIHTPHDRPEALTGAGMDEVARVIVEMLRART